MQVETISLELARRMALYAQQLAKSTGLPPGKEGVAQTVERLGYVQIDTIAVVERAHHHTLWTRRPDYDPQMLHELQAQDRRLFEYWGHAASYLPMTDLRFYLPRMRSYYNPKQKWTQNRYETHQHLFEPILDRIRVEGPLGSKDFDPPPGTKRGTWWDWKPAKVALELLFWRGELMITERRNFQRIYDLTERVLPADVDTHYPDDDEVERFFVLRALTAFGVAQEREIRFYMRALSREAVAQTLGDLVASGHVVKVAITDAERGEFYAMPEMLRQATQHPPIAPRVMLLSPFDNLIIQRERMEWLFGFAYALECYTPAAKRQYGYFTLPILWGDKLVGRLDPKADRKQKRLMVRGLFFEPEFAELEPFLPAFVERLGAFARFNGCETVLLEQVAPAAFYAPLAQGLVEANLVKD